MSPNVTRMFPRAVLFLAAAVALGVVSGCESVERIKAKRTVSVSLEIGKTRTLIKAELGDLIRLELPPTDLAGYGWQIFLLDPRYIKQMGEVHPGVGGGRPTVDLLAIKPIEKTTVRFLLVKQDGAKETQPVDGHDAVFSIE